MILVISRWRAVALTLAVVGPVAGAPAQAQTARGTASPVASSEVRALAHLEPESGAIVIGARPGMRVEQVRVAVGQDVKAGELLAYVWGGRAPRAVTARSDSAIFPGVFSDAFLVFRDSVVTIHRDLS